MYPECVIIFSHCITSAEYNTFHVSFVALFDPLNKHTFHTFVVAEFGPFEHCIDGDVTIPVCVLTGESEGDD